MSHAAGHRISDGPVALAEILADHYLKAGDSIQAETSLELVQALQRSAAVRARMYALTFSRTECNRGRGSTGRSVDDLRD